MQLKAKDISKYKITLKLNLRFWCNNAIFQINILESEKANCIVIQSKNTIYQKGLKYQFNNLNIIREVIVKRL